MLAGGTALRQRVDRRTAHALVVEGIGVHRHEQVGLRIAGLEHAIAQSNVVIAVTDHHRRKTRLRIHPGLQLAGHAQRHIFFQHTAGATCTGVFAAVAGIDGNHDGPLTQGARHGRASGSGRRIDDHPVHFVGNPGGLRRVGIKIHHHPVAVMTAGRQGKALGPHAVGHVQHHAQAPALAFAGADPLDHALALELAGDLLSKAGFLQIDHDPVRSLQGKQRVIGSGIQIEHHSGAVRASPDPQVFQVRRL